MNTLFIGDVVGQSACSALAAALPRIKHDEKIDLTIVNGENSADGNGITPFSANLLLGGGADVITTGNHCFKRREADNLFEENDLVLRPANYGRDCPGKGLCLLDYGSFSVAVINLAGTVYMNPADNPFAYVEALLEEIDTKNIFVDFHAEATSEKKAMGYFLSGKVSAVFGTHTHVQTADETVIDGTTGYITDAGMTGDQNSVLGVDKDIIIKRLSSYYPYKYVYPQGDVTINGTVVSTDTKTGRCLSIKRLSETVAVK